MVEPTIPALLDCPFCGGTPYANSVGGGEFEIACERCECSTQLGEIEIVAKLWNCRV